MSTLKGKVARLEERLIRLEQEMYNQEFWQRPPAPPPEYPTAEARECDWYQEPTGHVHVRFVWTCAVCGAQCDGVDRVRNDTPKQFTRLAQCTAGHVNKILFNKKD